MALLWLFIALGYLLLYAFAAMAPPPIDIFPPSTIYPTIKAGTGYLGQDALNLMVLEWLDMQGNGNRVESGIRCAC